MFGWIEWSELAILSFVVGLALASFVRIQRARDGREDRGSLGLSFGAVSLGRRLTSATREGLLRDAARCCAGVGAFLPTFVRIAPLWGGVLSVGTFRFHGHWWYRNTAEYHRVLMTLLFESLRHVAFGIAVSLVASTLHAGVVVLARRAVSVRVGATASVEWYAPTLECDSWTLGPHWPLVVLPPVGWVIALFLLTTEPFVPTAAVAADIGACTGESVTLRVVQRESDEAWRSFRVDVEVDAANLRDENDPEVTAINLQIDDEAEMQDVMVAIDRANDLPGRTICLAALSTRPMFEEGPKH